MKGDDYPRMSNVRFDHTIIPARDKRHSAEFFTRVFGLDDPAEAGFFLQVRLSDGRLLDFAEPGVDFPGHHYAFLVDDDTFDAIMERIRRDGIAYWADPRQRLPGQINTNHGGRGVYFDDPAGHHLEAITARYDGSALT
jgi:catechol 2,3-dioxygenase-like lactoylglutathione lyase family enzyme